MSGMALALMAAGGRPVSQFGGHLNAYRSGVSAAVVTLNLRADGTFDASALADTFSDGSSGDLWYSPQRAGVGSSYWVRATPSGDGPSGGAPTGSWINVTADLAWVYSSGTGGPISTRIGDLLIEVAASAGGPVLASGTYNFDVEREL